MAKLICWSAAIGAILISAPADAGWWHGHCHAYHFQYAGGGGEATAYREAIPVTTRPSRMALETAVVEYVPIYEYAPEYEIVRRVPRRAETVRTVSSPETCQGSGELRAEALLDAGILRELLGLAIQDCLRGVITGGGTTPAQNGGLSARISELENRVKALEGKEVGDGDTKGNKTPPGGSVNNDQASSGTVIDTVGTHHRAVDLLENESIHLADMRKRQLEVVDRDIQELQLLKTRLEKLGSPAPAGSGSGK